jgi:hypothetical protein
MRLHDLPLNLSRSDFNQKFAKAIITPKNTAAMSEPITGGVIVYVLQFDAEKLTSLRLTVNEDFNEESYQNLAAVVHEIIKAMPARGYAAPVKTTRQLAWKELIESPLPESGDRSIAAVSSEWNNGTAKANLTFSWTWPGQLLLEFSESQAI